MGITGSVDTKCRWVLGDRIDYRRINTITIEDNYPLHSMSDYIDALGEAKSFTTLDAN